MCKYFKIKYVKYLWLPEIFFIYNKSQSNLKMESCLAWTVIAKVSQRIIWRSFLWTLESRVCMERFHKPCESFVIWDCICSKAWVVYSLSGMQGEVPNMAMELLTSTSIICKEELYIYWTKGATTATCYFLTVVVW